MVSMRLALAFARCLHGNRFWDRSLNPEFLGSGGSRGTRDLGSGPKTGCRANIVQTPERDASIPYAQPPYRALYGSTTCHQPPRFDTPLTGFKSRRPDQ